MRIPLTDTFSDEAGESIYDNTTSGLTGATVQDAIDELAAEVTSITAGTSITGVVAAGPLKDLLTALAAEGLIVDNTTAT